MPTLNLKPSHKPVKTYYTALDQFAKLGVTHETAVRAAFQALLENCARQCKWTLVPEYGVSTGRGKRIVVDGALVDDFRLTHGYWEAKDIHDHLSAEVDRKFKAGYPTDNILFQTPQRALLWQNGRQVLDADLTDAAQLIDTLQMFFAYRPQEYAAWEEAVAQFKDRVADIGQGLAQLIQQERRTNQEFTAAFAEFLEKCRQSINPNLSEEAVEEMLIQHLLTERLFRTVFNRPAFTRRNVIAFEIENVIDALTSHAFSRDEFLGSLDRFYLAIERTAATISDFSQKQHFLNTVYEQFFQGFSVKVADTHGIVYTPQPIVDFMVKSVAAILEREFGRSLADEGVHIIDPFVGTGNFIVRIMREIPRTALEHKYKSELHCNEVMLLPYYIASMNIEHEYYDATGVYEPFEGICLVDTFDLAEDRQLPLFAPENTQRVDNQKRTPMFVVIGNPPYNMGQVNENDNNQNRKYLTMDKRVQDTYVKDSKATLRNKLSDPYVKAVRWASDRIGEEGVIAFVTNNSFLDAIAFDGMRNHLARDFDAIYILDLGGNVRKNPKLSGTTHNVFGIQVGVSINFLVKKNGEPDSKVEMYYAGVGESWRKEAKYRYLEAKEHYRNVEWKSIRPDKRHTWLTEGHQAEFETFVPMGSKEAKMARGGEGKTIFSLFSLGVATNRDAWVYSFDMKLLQERVRTFVEIYNSTVDRKRRLDPTAPVENFIDENDPRIKWTRQVKASLKKLDSCTCEDAHFRSSLYRPFSERHLYFDNFWNEERYQQFRIFPIPETEKANRAIVVPSAGGRADYWCFCTNIIPNLTLTSLDGSQCFPFYTYDEDGTNRRENITDWALDRFRAHYRDDTISKWDIFHYAYGLLHHPLYRERYQANLKRELPRIPFAPDFRAFVEAGARLATIHVDYEEQPQYQLRQVETPDMPLDWRVEKMRLSRDKVQLHYNDFLTLDGIPAAAFDYRLGNRSALEWIIDQYRIKTDRRSGIVNDPNRADDPQYIMRLIGKVISVSLETVKIVEALPELGVGEAGRSSEKKKVAG
ncbi:MAG: N-6 DNA methylase [Caldilineaceae bacterium SB0661_bin_32]|uniref:site-specific DNA-methyltransferase (adenine-specific) n=1 Tax=Caldilineaceae bacterium SB0661_bin_32 TaxID=2605255 RepID=A0A6B1D5R9_9CHLR|nr:N-6 DNA methylase [Caldilineaceae bacterium SB0661_bin_32]